MVYEFVLVCAFVFSLVGLIGNAVRSDTDTVRDEAFRGTAALIAVTSAGFLAILEIVRVAVDAALTHPVVDSPAVRSPVMYPIADGPVVPFEVESFPKPKRPLITFNDVS